MSLLSQLRVEAANLQADNPHLEIADKLRQYVLAGVRDDYPQYTLDIDAVADHLVQGGYSEDGLASMAVYLYPKKHVWDARGFMHTTPQIFNNSTIHYPCIGLAFPQSLPMLNFALRHELRHVLQDDTEPASYNKPWIPRAVRFGSVATAGAIMYASGELAGSTESIEGGLTTVLLGMCAATAAVPKEALNLVAPNEMDANIYAFKNRGFNPIKKV